MPRGDQCDFLEELSHLHGGWPAHLQGRASTETPPRSHSAPTGDRSVGSLSHPRAVPVSQVLPPSAALLNICSSFCITEAARRVWDPAVPPCIGGIISARLGWGVNTAVNVVLPQFALL